MSNLGPNRYELYMTCDNVMMKMLRMRGAAQAAQNAIARYEVTCAQVDGITAKTRASELAARAGDPNG